MFPFLFRDYYENLLKSLGTHEQALYQRDFAAEGFEMWETGLPITKDKSHPRKRHVPPEELTLIVGHVSAVKGGFGVSKRRVDHWTAKVGAHRSITLADGMAKQLVDAKALARDADGVFLPFATPAREVGQRIALWERFHGTVPYHQIGAQNGDNLANRPLADWTYHAGKGNYGVGWALDCHPAREPLTPFLIETGRASLTTLFHRVHEYNGGLEVGMAGHVAFSWPGRSQDPSEVVTREVIIPVVESLDFAFMSYEAKGGKAWPWLTR